MDSCFALMWAHHHGRAGCLSILVPRAATLLASRHGSRSLAGCGTVCLRFADFWDFYAASEIGFSTRYQQLQNMAATFTCYPGTIEDKGSLPCLAWNPLEPSISQFWEPDCCNCRHWPNLLPRVFWLFVQRTYRRYDRRPTALTKNPEDSGHEKATSQAICLWACVKHWRGVCVTHTIPCS